MRLLLNGLRHLLLIATLAVPATGCNRSTETASPRELLNVSYDPTRELWRQINVAFLSDYAAKTGKPLSIKQSHAGSSSQARAVIDGLEADVVTLALWTDTNAIAKAGLMQPDWQNRLPNRSLPYHSTIVFVVRKGNPKHIHDWQDLLQPDVSIITPNPKTSGNGKLGFLAAWGSVIAVGGGEAEARDFVAGLYQRVPVLDSGARAATVTFSEKKVGDVHLTWENEARLEVNESAGELEIVYPKVSIRAEPPVALVDANVDRHGTREAAEAYLNFLFTDRAQEIIARNFYRPSNPEILNRYKQNFPAIELFTIDRIAADWSDAETRFFRQGGTFDEIYQARSN